MSFPLKWTKVTGSTSSYNKPPSDSKTLQDLKKFIPRMLYSKCTWWCQMHNKTIKVFLGDSKPVRSQVDGFSIHLKVNLIGIKKPDLINYFKDFFQPACTYCSTLIYFCSILVVHIDSYFVLTSRFRPQCA